MAYKMKGSPMQRNFPGSFKQVKPGVTYYDGPIADIDRQMEKGVVDPYEYLDIKKKESDRFHDKLDADLTDAKVKFIQHITGLHENPLGEKIEQKRLDYLESLNE